MLIICRVIQGAVAGPIIPLSQSLLLNNYPPKTRYGTRILVNDRGGSTYLRANSGRLDQR